jgi:SsrA-binding protein
MPKLAVNKYAKSDYDLLEEFEGGLVLTGAEVKAAKKGSVNMKGAYLSIMSGELYLKNMHIGTYAPAGEQKDYDPTHPRKVLIHKKELKKLTGKKSSDGLTIVPLSVYTLRDKVKIGFALARGKKKYEKRASLKKRDMDRRVQEEMKKTRFGD